MESLSIRLLGPSQVSLARDAVSALRSDKALALLAYLAVESDRAHRREQLAGILWPTHTERTARANLRRALADLRQAIRDHQATPAFLLTTRQTVQFNTASNAWVDVIAFTTLLGPTRTPDPPNTQQLEDAMVLYRGPFLEGFSVADSPEFEEWVLLTREHLQRQAMDALDDLADTYEEQGEVQRALQHAWRQLELDPWREHVHQRIMRLLALGGKRDAALAQYETCRQVLEAELGVEPSEQTQELYGLLLREEWPPPALLRGAQPDRQPRAVGECPYRGLNAFREQDAPFFFGREDITALLHDAVRRRPLVAVVGPSGSGKSSAIFAGLLPQLRDGDARDWLVAGCRPGVRPFHSLAAALLPLLEPASSETDRLIEAQKLAAAWQAGDLSLYQAAERVLEKEPGDSHLLLIVDQFEELYTLCPDPGHRTRLLDLLLAAVQEQEHAQVSPLVLLLALRADFMGQALAHRPLADALQAGSLLMGPMNQKELRAAIEEPAEKQGAAFEPGLVDRILDDVGEEPGNLPLLEFALTLLWEQADNGWLTHEAYEALGRVEGALARYGEQVFSDLDPAAQERMPRILTQLVQPGEGTEDTRRVAVRGDVGEENWPLTRHLADKRLVVTGRDTAGNEIVEVAHEALIQHWGRFQGWLATHRAFRVWQEGLRVSLRQWETNERDEGALLRGAPLAQAEDWLGVREQELSEPERVFIRMSLELRERRAADLEAQRNRELASGRRARRLWAALAGVLAIATIIALALTLYTFQQRREALEAYSLSLAANAREALADLDTTNGLALALAANQIEHPPQEVKRLLLEAAYAPGARWRVEAESLFEGAEGPATTLDISSDGRSTLAGLADGSVVLWDLETREEIVRLLGHTASVNDVRFSPDGSLAISGGDDGQVIVWDLATGQEVRRFGGHSGVVRAVDISPDGRTAVSGGFGSSWMLPGELILWELETGREIHRFEGHLAGIVTARFTPDGAAVLASSGDAEIFSDELPEDIQDPGIVLFDLILWDAATGQVLRRLDTEGDDVFSLSISPDGTRALTGSFYNNVLALWDLGSGERLLTLEGHPEAVHTVAIGPQGRRALSGSYDDRVILWDLETGEPLARLDAHGSGLLDLAISPDGRSALSSSWDGGLILWDLVQATEVRRLTGHQDAVWDVTYTPDGKRALSSSGAAGPIAPVQDASIRLWDLETGQQIQASELYVDVIFQVAIDPGGSTALVAATEPFVRVWDLESWQEIGRLEGHAGPVTGIAFVPGGGQALSVSVDGTLILWDVAGKRAIHRFGGHGENLWSLAISPDGHTALSDSGDSSMVLWDLLTGQEIRTFVRQDSPEKPGSSGQAFLPDGRTALSCESDGYLIEWDLETGQEIRRLGQHGSLRTRVVVSPDGRIALTSGMDGALMLWDLESGELIHHSGGHGAIYDLALAPDSQTALFGSADTTIIEWRIDNPSLDGLKAWVSANRYLPDLTCAEREVYQIQPLCEPTRTE